MSLYTDGGGGSAHQAMTRWQAAAFPETDTARRRRLKKQRGPFVKGGIAVFFAIAAGFSWMTLQGPSDDDNAGNVIMMSDEREIDDGRVDNPLEISPERQAVLDFPMPDIIPDDQIVPPSLGKILFDGIDLNACNPETLQLFIDAIPDYSAGDDMQRWLAALDSESEQQRCLALTNIAQFMIFPERYGLAENNDVIDAGVQIMTQLAALDDAPVEAEIIEAYLKWHGIKGVTRHQSSAFETLLGHKNHDLGRVVWDEIYDSPVLGDDIELSLRQ